MGGLVGLVCFLQQRYRVTPAELKKVAGHNRLQRYLGTFENSSEILAHQLEITYPEYVWELWRFKHLRFQFAFYSSKVNHLGGKALLKGNSLST